MTNKTIYNPAQIIVEGLKAHKLDNNLTDSIKVDVSNFNPKTFKTPLTKELDNLMSTLEGDRLKELKALVKEKLQPLIKKSGVQKALLGDKVDTLTITIKKVNNTLVDDVAQPQFTASDLGSYRVVIEKKKEKVIKTFQQLLTELMEKEGKSVSDTRVVLDNMSSE